MHLFLRRVARNSVIVFQVLLSIHLAIATAEAAPKLEGPALARLIFQRVAGKPLLPSHPEYSRMLSLVDSGRLSEAASIPLAEDSFYQIKLKTFASSLFSTDENPYLALNDTQAMFIGLVRDDLDARTLLTGDFTYGPDPRFGLSRPSFSSNQGFESLSRSGRSLKSYLVRITPQWDRSSTAGGNTEAAGVLTSRGWAETYYSAGTNRRAVANVTRIFQCTPIEVWRESGLPEDRIRQDVDRQPGGIPAEFQNKCRTCHAQMDAFAGAFAHLDFKGNNFFMNQRVVSPKYLQNGETYADGFVTYDDSWINYNSQRSQALFGWRGALAGHGVKAFGESIAASKAFPRCMATRVYQSICKKSPEASVAQNLAQSFEDGGYRFKSLYAQVVAEPGCLGGGVQ